MRGSRPKSPENLAQPSRDRSVPAVAMVSARQQRPQASAFLDRARARARARRSLRTKGGAERGEPFFVVPDLHTLRPRIGLGQEFTGPLCDLIERIGFDID